MFAEHSLIRLMGSASRFFPGEPGLLAVVAIITSTIIVSCLIQPQPHGSNSLCILFMPLPTTYPIHTLEGGQMASYSTHSRSRIPRQMYEAE